MRSAETIAAVATPFGRSAVAVIRISGQSALSILKEIIHSGNDITPRKADLVTLLDGGSVIDSVIVTWFPAPRSFTGEDTVEISCHGSPYLTERVMSLILSKGARMASPGEFTMRAFHNGKLDLAQAEAVNDLINACSAKQLENAAYQLKGGFSREILRLRDRIIGMTGEIESAIDFAEEDIPRSDIRKLAADLLSDLEKLAEGYNRGRFIKHGIRLVLAGAPNVGKSTLFNAFLRDDRAIVSDWPGTTRDVLSETVEVKGIPVTFLDSAGIRTSGDPVELEGVRRSRRAISEADLVLVVLDASRPLNNDDLEVLKETAERKRIIVVNKTDLERKLVSGGLPGNEHFIEISALSSADIDRLSDTVITEVTGSADDCGRYVITNRRHFDSVLKASETVRKLLAEIDRGISHEFLAEDLKEAAGYLSDITGAVTTDDVLEHIFSSFCIGK